MQVTPNFDEAVSFENVEPGVYNARIDKVEPKTSKAGTPYLQWGMVIFGATGAMEKFNNRRISTMTMMEGKGAGRLQELLKATVGLPEKGQGFDTDALLGKEVTVTLVKSIKPDGSEGWPDVKSIKAYLPF
jgi:hypothetical protein